MPHPLPWSSLSPLLSTEVLHPSGASSRCPIKILDTAFISPSSSPTAGRNSVKVDSWLYTSKKGEVTKKKRDNLTLQKVFERFARFALANPSNNNGAKLVTVAFPRGGGAKRILDYGRMQEIVESNVAEGEVDLVDISAIRCFLRPFEGRDELWRVRYDTDNNSQVKVEVKCVEGWLRDGVGVEKDVKDNYMNDDVTGEITSLTNSIVEHVELAHAKLRKTKGSVKSMVCDFVLDDNRHLWLSSVEDTVIASTSLEIENDSPNTSHPRPIPEASKRPSLPSIDAADVSQVSQQQPMTPGASIFTKNGAGANAFWSCSKSLQELPGMVCWSNQHPDGTFGIHMQYLLSKWERSKNNNMAGPPGPDIILSSEEAAKKRDLR